MPEPDPEGVWIETDEDGAWRVVSEHWDHGNRRHRISRAVRILRQEAWGGWRCWGCGEPMPLFRRADARFCGEGCRKRAARARRRRRSLHQGAGP